MSRSPHHRTLSEFAGVLLAAGPLLAHAGPVASPRVPPDNDPKAATVTRSSTIASAANTPHADLPSHGTPLPPPPVNTRSVHNRDALRRLWQAMETRRVSLALVSDSNGRIFFTTGHEVGMTTGLAEHLPFWGSRVGPAFGSGGFGAHINSQSDAVGGIQDLAAPWFLTDLCFPITTTGYLHGYAYASDQTSQAPGSWNPPSLDFTGVPFDSRAELVWHYSYATFASGSGVMRPRVRLLGSPHTQVATGGEIITAPLADAVHWGALTIPSGDRGAAPYYIGIAELFGPNTEGPFGLTYIQFEVPSQATGVTYGPLWYNGGLGSHRLADDTVNRTFPTMWTHWFDAVTRNQGGSPADRILCLHVILGGNDLVNPTPAVDHQGAFTGPPTNTRAGHEQNIVTWIDAVTARWTAAGYSPENLYIILGPYHPKPADVNTGNFVAEECEPAWVALSQSRDNIIAVLGTAMVTSDEMLARGWYETPEIFAHLCHEGYQAYGRHTWATLAAAADCPTDYNHDDAVNSSDISAFLTAWLASTIAGDAGADFNQDGLVNSTDISAFLTLWLANVTGGC